MTDESINNDGSEEWKKKGRLSSLYSEATEDTVMWFFNSKDCLTLILTLLPRYENFSSILKDCKNKFNIIARQIKIVMKIQIMQK